MTYRVIQWSTGNVGTAALRCIIRHPDLELVGVWVHSADKAGQGRGGVVRAAADRRARDQRRRRAARARCRLRVVHRHRRPAPDGRDQRHGAVLRSGKNVVSSSVVAAIFPAHLEPSMREPLDDVCAKRGVVVLHVGHRSRVGERRLPLLLAGTCEDVEQLRVMEIVNYKDYEQPTVLFETMGFGKALDAKPLLLIPGVLSFAWGGVVKVLADGLGVEIDELREVHERRPAPEKIDLGFGVIEAGHDRGAALRGAGDRRR